MLIHLISQNAKVPLRGSEGAAGYDLFSIENKTIRSQTREKIHTGIMMEIPSGRYGRIASRSSMALKGIDVKAGVVDSDYRGEIIVLLHNTTNSDFVINMGDRIAQIIIEAHFTPTFVIVDDDYCISQTKRGDGGFGSTNTITT